MLDLRRRAIRDPSTSGIMDGDGSDLSHQSSVISMPLKEQGGGGTGGKEKAVLVVEQRILGPDLGHHASEGEGGVKEKGRRCGGWVLAC